jgi:hypothetical protein
MDYKFEFLSCNNFADQKRQEDDFSTYLLVPTTYKTREFCQEISAIQPEPSQVCAIFSVQTVSETAGRLGK